MITNLFTRFGVVLLVMITLFLYLQDVMTFQFLTYTYSKYYQLYVLLLFILVLLGYSESRSDRTNDYSIKNIGILGTLITIITVFTGLFVESQSLSLYLSVPTCFLSYFAFSYIAKNVPSNKLMLSAYILVGALLLAYLYNYRNVYLISMARNNAVYIVLLLLPLVMLNKNRVFTILMSVLILIAVASSAKRTGTVAGFLGFLVYLFFVFRNDEKNAFIKKIVIIIALVVVADFLHGSFINSLVFERLSAIDEDDGSRIDVMKTTFSLIKESNITSLFLGHGWNKVVVDSPIQLSAHNDFLEVIYDFGLITFGFYLAFIIQILKLTKHMIVLKSMYSGSLVCFVIIFLCLSMFSHIIIYPHLCIIMFIYLGIITGLINKDNENRTSYISLG